MDLLGGAWTLEAVTFRNFVCQNERIWILRGRGRAPGICQCRSASVFISLLERLSHTYNLVYGLHIFIKISFPNNGIFSKRTEMNLYLIFYLKIYIYIVYKKNQKWYILKYYYTIFGLF